MRKINNALVVEAEQQVIALFDDVLPKQYVFHTIKHTLDVAKNVGIIGVYCNLSEEELNIVRLSALFHDVGYVYRYDGHELESVNFADSFLHSHQVEEPVIQCIKDAILATEIPQHPKDIIGNILCDADLMHLTYKNYFEQIENMRLEWNNLGKKIYSPYQFHLQSIGFFALHHYHSEYGKKILQPKKEKTLHLIKETLSNLTPD